jgi:sugar phosphate isomerase/epimerase
MKRSVEHGVNGINLDRGHYIAAGNHDGLALIRKNHARITSMHLKDRKYKENGEANMPWDQGNTPFKEALQLMKKEGYKFPATIELEYQIPEGIRFGKGSCQVPCVREGSARLGK